MKLFCALFLSSSLIVGFSVANLSSTGKKSPTPGLRSEKAAQSQVVATEPYTIRPLPAGALHHGRQALPHIPNRDGTSLNWGGYAVETSLSSPQSGAVSAVAGSWTVPTLAASSSANTYSATWVGIDGYSDGSVEQIGTEQDWSSGGQQNYVWFEMYPKGGYEITGFPIAAGDVFSASVVYVGNGNFRLTISNNTQNQSYTVPSRYTRSTRAQRSSAEWIVEPPYSGGILPLADFGTINFTGCSATLNGITGSIGNSAWQNDPILMETSDGTIKAQPSGLAGGGSAFSVKWYHE